MGLEKKKEQGFATKILCQKKFGKQRFIVKKCVCLVNLTAEL